MEINHSRGSLKALIDILTDINRLPLEYDASLQPFYDEIKKDKTLSDMALKRCQSIFERWDIQDDSDVKEEIVKRCMNLWLTLKGVDYVLRKPLPDPPNLVVQEVEVNDFVDKEDLKRLEFELTTGKVLKNSLANLIIEEVEALDFVDSGDDAT